MKVIAIALMGLGLSQASGDNLQRRLEHATGTFAPTGFPIAPTGSPIPDLMFGTKDSCPLGTSAIKTVEECEAAARLKGFDWLRNDGTSGVCTLIRDGPYSSQNEHFYFGGIGRSPAHSLRHHLLVCRYGTFAPTGFPIAPTGSPIAPTGSPIQETFAPTGFPIAPTGAPIQETFAPTGFPIAPTGSPIAPTGSPIQETFSPTGFPIAPTDSTPARNCQELLAGDGSLQDGEYTVYPFDDARGLTVYCRFGSDGEARMSIRVSEESNYSKVAKERLHDWIGYFCSSSWTQADYAEAGFTKFREYFLATSSEGVYIEDDEFDFPSTWDSEKWARDSDGTSYRKNIRVGYAGDCYSWSGHCDEARRGEFKIDLTGTGFAVADSVEWAGLGWGGGARRMVNFKREMDGQVISANCGGWCGRCEPTGPIYLKPAGIDITMDRIQINFQPSDMSVPSGYLRDSGEVFQARESGLSYGWSCDFSGDTRDRFNRGTRNSSLVIPDRHRVCNEPVGWKIALPNGRYGVKIGYSDPEYGVNTGACKVNGRHVGVGFVSKDGTGGSYLSSFTVTNQELRFSGRWDGAKSNSCTSISYIHIKLDILL